MQNINSVYNPTDESRITLNELLLVYRNFFNEEDEYMQSKFTRKTMEKILKQETGFMDRLMHQIESRPNFKSYLEYVIDFDIDEEVKVTKEPKTA